MDMDAVKILGALLALVTTPACAFLAAWNRRLYADSRLDRAETIQLTREVLDAIRAIRNGSRP